MIEHSATKLRRGRQLERCERNDTKISVYIALLLGLIASTPSFSQATESTATPLTLQPAPIVAAASSFRAAWPSIQTAYQEEPRRDIRISFGSSGLLSTQILHGAPFELFLSADEASVQRLQQTGKTQGDPYPLVEGQLYLVSRQLDSLSLDALRTAVENGEPVKVAIANPRHAPYGIAARQALTNAGIWPLPRHQLLQAENASQALQFALSQAATLAIVPSALVYDLPDNATTHKVASKYQIPVVHFLTELKQAGPAALAFSRWLKTPAALNVLHRFGLSKLEENDP